MSGTGIEIRTGSTVFLDTSPFIYFIEEVEPYYSIVKYIFEKNSLGEFQIVTSTLTHTEVLTLPLKKQAARLAIEYDAILLRSPFVYLASFDIAIAKNAAEIRATYGIQTADAIQVATAVVSGSEMFVTNDKRLSAITEIKVIQLSYV
jgi:predicted nucleic acid-binding protein